MQKTFTRLWVIFFALFVAATVAVAARHFLSVKPHRECVAGGGWWAPKSRTCATPIDITEITGRARGEPRPNDQPRP